jgi:carbonic anhydrase/acetyltransferase-like protein (isoleucine patch superfamily)
MNDPIILSYDGQSPTIDKSAWVAPGAVISGNTRIEADSSVWFGAVLRGDINRIRIGRRTNIQDGAVCHVNFGDAALEIGDDVSVGHGAVLHGCTLESGCLVGIGARVLDGAVVGRQSLVAAGSVVREGTRIPAGELWAGAPAVKKRDLSEEEKKGLLENAAHYVEISRHYAGRK